MSGSAPFFLTPDIINPLGATQEKRWITLFARSARIILSNVTMNWVFTGILFAATLVGSLILLIRFTSPRLAAIGGMTAWTWHLRASGNRLYEGRCLSNALRKQRGTVVNGGRDGENPER